MRNVIFVAPFLLETTLRFVKAVAELPQVRLGVISQEPLERLPEPIRRLAAAHRQVQDGLDPRQIAGAVAELRQEWGGLDRLLGALEQLQVPLAEVREHLGIPGLGVEAAKNFRDKARMKTVLRQAHLPCARHREADSPGAVQEFLHEVGFPVVVKPPAGAAAKDTYRIDDEAALRDYLGHYPLRSGQPVLFEEFMTGDEYSFDSVCIDGRPIWYSISRYYPAPLEVMRNPWIQWCVVLPRELDRPEYRRIQEVGFAAVQVLGLRTGLSHMEWFRRPEGGVAISEVGARPPGAQFCTLISYAYSMDFYGAYARLMVFEEFESPPRDHACGAVFLRGQGGTRVKAIHGVRQAQEEMGELVVEARLPRPGQTHGAGYEGDGYVIVRHPSTEVVEKALSRLLRIVTVELE